MRKRVRRLVSGARFEHVERVAELARRIALANAFSEAEVEAVVLAAILHDAARELSDVELTELAPPASEIEVSHPLSLHGRASRVLAERWGVRRADVLEAIEGHVFGVPLTNRVGMALYVADISEPGRGVNHDLRELALTDLDAAYRKAVCIKVDYLRECGKQVHPHTLAAYKAIHEALSEAANDAP